MLHFVHYTITLHLANVDWTYNSLNKQPGTMWILNSSCQPHQQGTVCTFLLIKFARGNIHSILSKLIFIVTINISSLHGIVKY